MHLMRRIKRRADFSKRIDLIVAAAACEWRMKAGDVIIIENLIEKRSYFNCWPAGAAVARCGHRALLALARERSLLVS